MRPTKPNVLVVLNEEKAQEHIHQLLEKYQCAHRIVETGQAAWQSYELHAKGHYSLFVIDNDLFDPFVTCEALCRMLRLKQDDTPIWVWCEEKDVDYTKARLSDLTHISIVVTNQLEDKLKVYLDKNQYSCEEKKE